MAETGFYTVAPTLATQGISLEVIRRRAFYRQAISLLIDAGNRLPFYCTPLRGGPNNPPEGTHFDRPAPQGMQVTCPLNWE